MTQEQTIIKLRQKLMSTRRVICTGNPDKPFTIAHGIRKLYPDATFLHKSNGWDLTNELSYAALAEQFVKHNTFINASYIDHGVQYKLLDLCNRSVKFCDVVNMGSTHEYDGQGSVEYKNSKIDLKNLSLSLNTYRFRTCHFILGSLKTNDIGDDRQLDIDTVCNMIPWVFEQKFELPVISIDNKKAPW
jgi:hypothetical protein